MFLWEYRYMFRTAHHALSLSVCFHHLSGTGGGEKEADLVRPPQSCFLGVYYNAERFTKRSLEPLTRRATLRSCVKPHEHIKTRCPWAAGKIIPTHQRNYPEGFAVRLLDPAICLPNRERAVFLMLCSQRELVLSKGWGLWNWHKDYLPVNLGYVSPGKRMETHLSICCQRGHLAHYTGLYDFVSYWGGDQ